MSFESELKWKFCSLTCLSVVLIFFWICSSNQAQIVITDNEIPAEPGTTNEYYVNGVGTVPVDVGHSDGPQTWDFSQGSMADSVAETIVRKDETPFGDEFSEANLVYDTDGINIAGIDTAAGFMYMKLDEGEMVLMGAASQNIFGVPLSIVLDSSLTILSLPLEYGTIWSDSTFYLNIFEELLENPFPNPLFPDPFVDAKVEIGFVSEGEVDAWGTVMTPQGQFRALRIKRNEVTRLKVSVFLGFDFQPVFDSTQTVIAYDWYAENVGSVVTVTSLPGETDANFTEANRVRRLIRTNADVGDVTGDNIKDVLDLLAVIDHILEIQLLEGDAVRRADCNYDGIIDILDLFGIVCVILDIDDCKP